MNGFFRFLSSFLILLVITCCGKEVGPTTAVQSKESAVLNISDAAGYNFGSQSIDSVSEKVFTITNIGTLVATQLNGSFYLSLNYAYKGGNFPGVGGTCSSILQAHTDCTVIVTFIPKLGGSSEATLTLSYHNGISDVTMNGPHLTGVGVGPEVNPSPTPSPSPDPTPIADPGP